MIKKQPRIIDKKYLAWIRTRSCVVADIFTSVNCIGDIIYHHTRSRGAFGSDYETIPLCMYHHQLIHQIGRYSFQNMFGIDFKIRIIQLLKAYPNLWMNEQGRKLLKELEAK